MTRRFEAKLWAGLIGAICLTGVAQHQIEKTWEWRFPALTSLVVTEHYTQDLSATFLGTRRLAGDLAYIQFLQYYGVPEGEEEGHEESPGHEHHHSYEGGVYSRAYEFGQRLVRLNPFFNGPVLEMAGALAFNLKRPKEGLALLAEAIRLDPAFYRYRVYVAAILYKNNNRDDRLIDMLEEAMRYPDCPVLLQRVLGNLLIKNGLYLRAAYVFRHIAETAKQAFERESGLNSLKEIVIAHPEARTALDGPGRY